MLQQWLMPQLQEDKADFILQQDDAFARFLGNIRDYLNAELLVVGSDVLLEMTIPFFVVSTLTRPNLIRFFFIRLH